MIVNGECRFLAVSMFVKAIVQREKLSMSAPGWMIDQDGRMLIEAKILEYGAGKKSEAEIFVDQIMDNEVRKAMGPLETLNAYSRALDLGVCLDTLSRAFGKSKQTIEADLPILQLPEILLKEFDKGGLNKAVARKLAELPAGKVMKAYEWSRRGRDVAGQLAKIEAYRQASSQMSLDVFDQAAKEAEPQDRKEARKTFGRLQRTIAEFSQSPYANGKGPLMIVANSRELSVVEQTAIVMAKIAEKMLADLRAYRARDKRAAA
jgi:hypothetical protein